MGSTIQEYLASLRGKRVAVLGIGVSNTPLIKMLLRADVEVTACDKRQREDFGGQAEELESLGAELRLGPDYLDGLDHDVIFRTPGLRPDVPQLLAARERGSTITSEMEVFFQVCPCKTIAVTGSDGKTTTTTIIAELLKAAGQSVYVGGNIGKPLLPDVDGMVPEDVAVLELSSFQLMTMEQSPDIAVVTNLAPNHLDVHKSMEEYIAAKENIFTHQGADGLLVLNQDNEITRGFAVSARGRVTRFSRREELEQGVFVRDGAIWVRNAMHERPVLYLENILLPGEHNIENYMAAIGALDGLVPDQVVRDFAAKFAGVEHRIELVRTRNGVRYYNDSIASSPSRTGRRRPSGAWRRRRARSSARPTAPKASAPNSAMRSRVVHRPSSPSRAGSATQAAVQPTPTAASVPTMRQRPPMVGVAGGGRSSGSLSGCS